MIKIAVLTKPIESATTFYRSTGVWGYLGREMAGNGWQIQNIGPKNFTPDTAAGYDICFAHRPVTDDELRALRNGKLSGGKIWVDLDDLLWMIPVSNPSHSHFGPGARENLRKAMEHADVITTSTPELARQIKFEYNREAIVIPNAWNDYALPIQEPAPIVEDEKIRIVYRGSNSHDGDLFAHRDAFREYDNIEFTFMGAMPWYFYTTYGGHMKTVIHEGWQNDIFGYFQRLIALKPHFVVFPLEDNTFNRCKSNIAAIEATIAGAVCIAPRYMPEFEKISGVQYLSPSNLEGVFDLFNLPGMMRAPEHFDIQKSKVEELRLSEINKQRAGIAQHITGKI